MQLNNFPLGLAGIKNPANQNKLDEWGVWLQVFGYYHR
jgi:hypothetical protein